MAVLLVAVSACKLFTKDIEVPQKFSIQINQQANASQQFSTTKDVDTGSEDVRKYQDKIDDFKIDKLTFTVSNFTSSASPVVSGTLKFAVTGTTNYKTLGSVTNADLKALAGNGQEVAVAITDEAAKNDLVTQMRGGNKVTFKLEGTTTAVPVVATMNFKIYANMTVGL